MPDAFQGNSHPIRANVQFVAQLIDRLFQQVGIQQRCQLLRILGEVTAAGRFAQVVIFAIVGVSLVILTGWAGQISLGQFAFAGVGSLVASGMAVRGWDFFACLFAAGLAGALAAILVGLPALRIQGLFLAVTTLAFAFTVEKLLLNV